MTTDYNDALSITRQCALMLNTALANLQLANKAEHFDGEDPAQWQIYDSTEIRVTKHNIYSCTIYRNPPNAEIVIPDVSLVIRREHRSKFDHREHNIQALPPKDFKGDREPQLVIKCKLPSYEHLIHGDRRLIHRMPTKRRPKVIRQYERFQ